MNATGSADPVGANASKNGPDTQRGKIGNVQLKIKVEVAKEDEKEKTVTEEELLVEESRLLAESYKAHRKLSNPPEEFWVPVM